MTLAPLLQLEPLGISKIILMPGIVWVFAVVAWIFAAYGRRNGKAPKWKWVLAYGLMIASIYCGWAQPAGDENNLGFGRYISDSVYREYFADSYKLVIGEYVSFFLPLLSLGVLIYLDKREIGYVRRVIKEG